MIRLHRLYGYKIELVCYANFVKNVNKYRYANLVKGDQFF